MKVLVTGSSGFLGSRFVIHAREEGISVRQVARAGSSASENFFYVNSIDEETDWSGAFIGVDCIVHCAARVHQMTKSEVESLDVYREVNTRGTMNLARQAVKAGVKRFVFISSIKVNGEFTEPGQQFKPDLANTPDGPYGLSKYEAEVQLGELSREAGLEVVIIRPPLVYGPGVKANFLSMIRWMEKGIPLPLGAIYNLRSLVYIDNLVDLMLMCCRHPKAVGETFLVSDDNDLSTTQLLSTVAAAMGKSSRLLPIPMSLISFSANLIGMPEISRRLCGSLQVDISHTKNTLAWVPPVTFEEGIKKTVQAYLDSK
ncbi:UDP-glucose 4-epimerase family protein [Vibrio coralliilyticus]|uniref:UDP-glucose 4-epimerase family protein n=1 Tax=Vibrio coralliilyticus TaxID=190893 RepID=UPI00148E2C7A|nr:SDR family oxidoreductase [Vibrio coralliilyticus]NOI30696.1 SDR family oxidoreductase [Vibrio coralliilyticus]NOI49756.1 SDR family oxidoreductase [Vibrio coralliilyticus]WFB48014.1 SDR family oxidoreductase [Vibrio coralliilyticus]